MLQLALPVVLTYLGMMLMGVVDLLFVGRVDAVAIGAVGLGTSLFSWAMIFGVGLLAGLDYLVSFAQGAGRPEDGHRALVQGLIVSTLVSVPLTATLVALATHLELLGVNAEVRLEASRYLMILAPSLWPALVFNACRQYLTAMNVTLPALVILAAANALNAAVNYALVPGHWGFAAMGASGSAIATLVSRLAMMVAMYAYLRAWDRGHHGFFARLPGFRADRAQLARFLKLGFPSAMHMTLEVGVFALSTMLAARLAADALAAHQIVLNIASLTFMVPLGVSSATAVLVGQAMGRGQSLEAARMGWRGIAAGVGYMLLSGIVLFAFRGPILATFTTDVAVRGLAAQVILVAALFQLSDGAQVVGAGALRGLGDTRSAAIGNLAGHWLVGFPLGMYLCFRRGWGLVGLWTGLSAGLSAVAGLLLWAWVRRTRARAP